MESEDRENTLAKNVHEVSKRKVSTPREISPELKKELAKIKEKIETERFGEDL